MKRRNVPGTSPSPVSPFSSLSSFLCAAAAAHLPSPAVPRFSPSFEPHGFILPLSAPPPPSLPLNVFNPAPPHLSSPLFLGG